MTRSRSWAVVRTVTKRLAEELSSSPEPESEPEFKPHYEPESNPELEPQLKRQYFTNKKDEFLRSAAESEKSFNGIWIETYKKFGTRQSKNSVRKRTQRLGVHSRKAPLWTEEEIILLEELVKSHGDFTTAARLFLKETGTNRTVMATVAKARLITSVEPAAWTEEEDALLNAVFGQHDTWAARLSAFQPAAGTSRTVQCLTRRAKALGLELSTQMAKPWTEEEDMFLKNLLSIHDNWKDIHDEFQGRFGPDRAFDALRAEGVKTRGSHRFNSYKKWTKEKLDFINSLPASKNWKEIVREFENKFGYRRDESSLLSRLRHIKLDSGAEKRDHNCKEEEVPFLEELILARKSWDTILFKFHRRFGLGRTD